MSIFGTVYPCLSIPKCWRQRRLGVEASAPLASMVITPLIQNVINILNYKFCGCVFVDLYKIMRRDRNFTKLLHVWKGWYDNSTKDMKPEYTELVKLWNEVSVENGKPRETLDIFISAREAT